MNIERVVCWFSCGATSAVATKLAIERYSDDYPIVVAYCDTGSEHPDNHRFLVDCENWFGIPITTLKSDKYSTIYDVFDATHYLAGVYGARCSLELKKAVRRKFENLDADLQIFGFDLGESKRAERFRVNNPEVTVEFPLIDASLSKSDCIVLIQRAGIELPAMYKMGYTNNNCIGCVKGGAGYWNKIRQDFPDVFERMAQYEEKYGARLVMSKKKHITLRELDPKAGNYKSELPIQCGFFCGEL